MDIYDWLVVAFTVLLCVGNLVYIRHQEMIKQKTVPELLFAAGMLAVCALLSWYLGKCGSMEAIYHMKVMALVTLLWPIALQDYKSHIIPNRLLIIGLIYRGIILIAELMFFRKNLISVLLAEVIYAAAILLVCFLILLVMKSSLGMGDVKLFIVMALFLNAQVLIAIMGTLIVSFFLAIFLLITKKKGRKDVIPFAPAILAGTCLTVLLVCL